jgi:hypothetical protein
VTDQVNVTLIGTSPAATATGAHTAAAAGEHG